MKEELIKAGFTEEQALTIIAIHQKVIDGSYVPKATFDAEREKVKQANKTIEERDAQIVELGKFKGNSEELQATINRLTEENTRTKTEYEQKIKDIEECNAIRSEIIDKVYNVEDIIGKLDRTKITYKEGKVIAGLVEQLDAIKKTSPHYFKQETHKNNSGPNLPGGFNFFGSTPDENFQNPSGANSSQEFGKSLAKAVLQGASSTQKAADIYFK